MAPFDGQTIVITGGTGTFGTAMVRYLLATDVRKVRVLSRGEHRQAEMSARFADPRLRCLVGDVRDRDRLTLAFHGADVVFHAAALKRIEKCAYDPGEANATNITGTWNVVRAAMDAGVRRLVSVSSDKACLPITHYGFTKAVAESTVLNANAYLGGPARFSVVRYGNVAGSQGSVIPIWRELVDRHQPLPVTDVRMTRFWITIDEAVAFTANVALLPGGQIHVPRMPSFKVVDLALAIQGSASPPFVITGHRGTEKLHEDLVAPHEDHIISPWSGPMRSDQNPDILTVPELRARVARL